MISYTKTHILSTVSSVSCCVVASAATEARRLQVLVKAKNLEASPDRKRGVEEAPRPRDGRNHMPGLPHQGVADHAVLPGGARREELDPAPAGLEGRCSIRLSYGRL